MAATKYFDDLSNYSYRISPYELRDVWNIGWINPAKIAAPHTSNREVIEKLKLIASSGGGFDCYVERIRGLPECPVCGEVKCIDYNGNAIPEAELWIPSGDGVTYFASPSAIIHLMEVHGYEPPVQFCKAVLKLDVAGDLQAQSIYLKKLEQSGWYESDEYRNLRNAASRGK